MIKKNILLVILFLTTISLYAQNSAIESYGKGQDAYSRRNWYLAIEEYKKALQQNEFYFAPLLGLGKSFFALNEYEEALKYVEQAAQLNSKDPDLLVLYGRILTALGEYDEARKKFFTLLLAQPNNVEGKFGLGEIELLTGKNREAAAVYLETLKIAPANKEALIKLVNIYMDQKDWSTAELYLELALKKHASDPHIHYEAGKYYSSKKNWPVAEKFLNTALALNPENFKAHYILGKDYLHRELYDKSLENFEKALKTPDPFLKALIRYTMGTAYTGKTDFPAAIRNYELALKNRYDDEVARIAIETLALKQLTGKDSVRRDLADYHFNMGLTDLERNYLRKAAASFRRAIQLFPDHKEARINYSRIFKVWGYPVKYYYMLKVLVDYYKEKNTFIEDELALYEDYLYGIPSARWNSLLKQIYSSDDPLFNQYKISKNRNPISLYGISGESKLIHPEADSILIHYFDDILRKYEQIEMKNSEFMRTSFNEAYREAKSNGSDYFIVVQFHETERTFEIRGEIYLSRTGSKMEEFSVFRTGNNRVNSSFFALSEKIFSLLPSKGTLLGRKFNTGLMNLGRLEGIEKEDVFYIIKKNAVKLDYLTFKYIYDSQDILGRLTITEVDENFSVGTIEKQGFFDYINPGDELIFIPPPEPTPEPTPPPLFG